MNYVNVINNQTLPISSIPELEYSSFLEQNVFHLIKAEGAHCVNYYGFPFESKIKLICCIANDVSASINVSSCVVDTKQILPCFTNHNLVFEKFEREIHENFGIQYADHPWLKPVRFPFNRANKNIKVTDYPFFQIESEELHEVGVGPIHASIIEPAHFRFICNGEQILHLEIQMGYQHRGVEQLFLEKKKLLQRTILSESIAGDSVAGHSVAFVNLWESLCGFKASTGLRLARTIALELERIAIHTGDLSGMCTDVGYQLGSAVFGRLRTPVINYFQKWCGNRFAKGLIRAGKSNFPFTKELADQLLILFNQYEPDFEHMCKELFGLPTVLARFEKTAVVSTEQAATTGAVGMAARMSGIKRDIRFSHPYDLYPELGHQPVIKHHGDVYSRAQIRKEEIRQSMGYIRKLIQNYPQPQSTTSTLSSPCASSFSISLVEGWRGEICHCAITDDQGALIHYKIKDPSFHNWLAEALSVRNNEISDFPICNKSFDLSYSGHDL